MWIRRDGSNSSANGMIDDRQLDRIADRLAECERLLASPGVTADYRRAAELAREHLRLRKVADKARDYRRCRDEYEQLRELADAGTDDDELRAMALEEIDPARAALEAAEQVLMPALLPPDPDDERNAMVEIRAGTGGDEAGLFAADLLRMYKRYADAVGWKVSLIHACATDIGGFKELICSVSGEGVYGRLRYESGCHRVQRVPQTEASGRIHTSAATVAVFPETDASDAIDIPPDDLRIDIFCSSGPGGQSVNTTYSAVRVTHLPTGLVAQSQDERSQHRNREKALSVLKARLRDHQQRLEQEQMGNSRRSLIGSGDRSERIRTYNFPQNRLTDHRINLTLYSLDRIVEGDLDELLDALKAHDVRERLEQEQNV